MIELTNYGIGRLPVRGIGKSEIVSTIEKLFRDDFAGSSLDLSKWQMLQLGAGQAITVSGSELQIAAGATANSETILRSADYYSFPFRTRFILQLTGRDANREIYLEITNAAGDHVARFLLDGTVGTTYKHATINASTSDAVGTSTGWTDSATYQILEIDAYPDEVWMSQRPANSTAGTSAIVVKQQKLPDPNQQYFIQIRVKNLATAPAAQTLKVDAVLVQDINELTAEITGGRGYNTPSNALPVNVGNSVTVGSMPTTPVNLVPSTTAGGGSTFHKLIAAATTNATSVKASAGNLIYLHAFNASAATKYLKLYNKASAPTVGTDVPVLTIPIEAGKSMPVPIPAGGFRFGTGLAYAITGSAADADTTAVAAGDVIVGMVYA